ncbi:prepilin-type N-terminal cleavage/methylation domain-containing protein [Candidatus Halobeggiatoa sp. HSG11]|nr:prepilin-type N-terminal cleavage/methylation domain-containing protein [Candidatus Halobeggiatoa sp. HSG11]
MQFKLNNHGYSLLELLVVLLVFSLLAGITVPRLVTMYDSVQVAFERDEVLSHLGELGYLAFRQSHDFTLTDYPPPVVSDEKLEKTAETQKKEPVKPSILALPEGWKIRVETPILFRANGVCNGGTLQLQYQQQKFKIQLKSPFCQPELIDI